MPEQVERFEQRLPRTTMDKAFDGSWVPYSECEKLVTQRDRANEALEEAERRATNWKRRAESADRQRDQAKCDREVESQQLVITQQQRDWAHLWAQRLAGVLAALIHSDTISEGGALEVLGEAEAAGIDPQIGAQTSDTAPVITQERPRVREALLSIKARDTFLVEFKEWANPEKGYWEAMKAVLDTTLEDDDG